MFLARFGLLTAFLLAISVTSQFWSAAAQSLSSSGAVSLPSSLLADTSHVKSSTRKTGSVSRVGSSTRSSSRRSHTTTVPTVKSSGPVVTSRRSNSTASVSRSLASSASRTSSTRLGGTSLSSSPTASETGSFTSSSGASPSILSSSGASFSGVSSSSVATSGTFSTGASSSPRVTSSRASETGSITSRPGASSTAHVTSTTSSSIGVFIYPPSSVSSATSKATAATAVVGTFQKNPTKENAQSTKDKVEDALAVAGLLALGGGILGGLFGSLASALGATAAAASAALTSADLAAAAVAVAATIPAVEAAIEEIKKEKEKEEQNSKTNKPSTRSASKSSSTSSCSVRTVTDFYVSCISGPSTKDCSTYTRSVLSGCSATASTITTVSSATASLTTDTEIDNDFTAANSNHKYTVAPGKAPQYVVGGKYTLTLGNSGGATSTGSKSSKSAQTTLLSRTTRPTNAPTTSKSASVSTTSKAATSSHHSTHTTSSPSPSTSAPVYTSILNIPVTVPTNTPGCQSNLRVWKLRQSVDIKANEKINSVNLFWNVKDASKKAGKWVAIIQYAEQSMKNSVKSWQAGSGSSVSTGSSVKPDVQFNGGENQAATFLRLFVSTSKETEFTVTITGTFDCIVPPDPPKVPENPDGTQVIIDSGCHLVNMSPRCNANVGHISAVYEGSYHVDANQGETSTATILANFDQKQWYARTLPPGCQLNAHWPRNYRKVIFRQDGCLYDEGGNNIDGQCCSTPDADHSGAVINPWRDPRPAGSCKRTPFGVGVHFEMYIKDWVNDNADRLWKEIEGCSRGGVTGKGFGTNHEIQTDGSDAGIGFYQADYLLHFNLPITFKPGCVGRAMVSAGAPPGRYC